MDLPLTDAKALIWDNSVLLLDAFPAGVVICDEAGIIVFSNSELSEMFGYSKDELIGQTVEMLIPTAKAGHHKNLRQSYMQAPEKRNMGNEQILYAQHKDGHSFQVEVGLNPISSSVGMQIIVTVVDISERIHIENNFRNVVDAAPVGMLIMQADGKIRHCNQKLLDIFGYTAEELQDQVIETLVPERHRQTHLGHIQNFLHHSSTRPMGLDLDLTGVHKSGTEIPLEIGLNPIDTGDGLAVIAAIVDITERKKAELKLKQINADLDEFTYVASHDLKSPLRGISNLIEWIEEDLGDGVAEDVKHNLDRVHVRIERMEKLIEDLLAYARSGRQAGSATTIHLDKLLDDVIDMCNLPEGFKVNISGYQSIIRSSVTPLETVLRNLISNAVKHHDKTKGEINIHIEQQGAFCQFEICDDGPGIPVNAHERIFKLFQTLNSSQTGRSGVGLAVCKRLVESCNGRIELASNDGQRGSCFRFWWPSVTRRDINE